MPDLDASADPGFAPAKLNLALHVVGQRADGYHELESLVVFASVGDRVDVTDGDGTDHLTVSGRFAAGVPVDGSNIVLKAVTRLREAGADVPPLRIRLVKNLPHAAGIGGGSADAGALLRLLVRRDPTLADLARDVARRLGADVPMCLLGQPTLASGIGDVCAPLPAMPELFLLLANPGVAIPTPPVFAALARKQNPPLPAMPAGGFATLDALLAFLAQTRNDLAQPAETVAPAVREALAALDTTGPLFRRMSGSGATVFALYRNPEDADRAAQRIRENHPHWWVETTRSAAVVREEKVPA